MNATGRLSRAGRAALAEASQKLSDVSDAIISGRYRQAVELADEGLSLLENVAPVPERDEAKYDLVLERGRARVLMGEYTALADFQIARAEAPEPAQQVSAMVGIAECHSGSGDYAASEEAFRMAKEEAHAGGYDLYSIRSWSGLGTVYWKQGRLDEAVQALHQARTILQRTPDVYEMGRALLSLGITHNYAGRLDQAIIAYEEALKCFRTVGDDHRVSAALNNLGELHQSLRDMERALRYHEEAVAVADRAGADRISVDITRNIGVDLLLMGRYSEAMIALNEALSRARALGDKDFVFQALYSLGDALLRQGDVGRAMTVASELAAEAKAVRSELHTARAKYLQGRGHLAHGERDEAQVVFQDALKEAHAATSRMLLWQLHAALGRAIEDPAVAQIHFRIAADFIKQTVEPLTDPNVRARFLEQPEVRAVLDRAK